MKYEDQLVIDCLNNIEPILVQNGWHALEESPIYVINEYRLDHGRPDVWIERECSGYRQVLIVELKAGQERIFVRDSFYQLQEYLKQAFNIRSLVPIVASTALYSPSLVEAYFSRSAWRNAYFQRNWRQRLSGPYFSETSMCNNRNIPLINWAGELGVDTLSSPRLIVPTWHHHRYSFKGHYRIYVKPSLSGSFKFRRYNYDPTTLASYEEHFKMFGVARRQTG